jgi:hypothetical protein
MIARRLAFICVAIVLASLCATNRASAWDEEGHAIVTRLAFAKLPASMPTWIKDPRIGDRLAYLSSEPDRWRGQHSVQLDHCNNPDHYFDAEDIRAFGLNLTNLPLLRREFCDILASHRALHPDKFEPRKTEKDEAYTDLVPGLLPYTIAELQWKIASSWTTLKTYEENRELVTESMIQNARENVVFHMGILSHFVGDGAQPLHMTRHHHGWVGDNPKGYTTEPKFHSYIDGGVIAHHHITAESLLARARPARKVSQQGYWGNIAEYLNETYQLVEPIYELEKSGELKQAKGKQFIEDRLIEGGSMLAGVWVTAYESAVIDDFRVKALKRKAAEGSKASHTTKP